MTETDSKIRAVTIKHIDKGNVRGAVNLYIPRWHATLLGCLWVKSKSGDRLFLPRRTWKDRDGGERSAEFLVFDNTALLQRFEAEALRAIAELAARGNGGSRE
jgi:hypothetical protein